MTTTLIRRRADMPHRLLPRCHDGEGDLDWTIVLDGGEPRDRRVHFVHDDVLPAGASIGVHVHDQGEEYYLILSGEGIMTLDGVEHAVGPGDLTAVFAGGSHGLRNIGSDDLRVIVWGA